MVYSDAWGKLIHEKNQKSKILWHCPFKVYTIPTEIWQSEATFDPPVNAKGIKNECGQTNSLLRYAKSFIR